MKTRDRLCALDVETYMAGTIDQIIEQFNVLKRKYKYERLIVYEENDYYDGVNYEYVLYGEREETAEEANKRKAEARKKRAAKKKATEEAKQNEIAQLKKLMKKYKNEI